MRTREGLPPRWFHGKSGWCEWPDGVFAWGFPVYLKSTEYSATLIEDGVSYSFEDWADVLKVRYGSIESPEEI